jgi:hypothetical protein
MSPCLWGPGACGCGTSSRSVGWPSVAARPELVVVVTALEHRAQADLIGYHQAVLLPAAEGPIPLDDVFAGPSASTSSPSVPWFSAARTGAISTAKAEAECLRPGPVTGRTAAVLAASCGGSGCVPEGNLLRPSATPLGVLGSEGSDIPQPDPRENTR